MLRINITRDGNDIKKITFMGHTDYSDMGYDIVCAACSATMLCTVNAIFSIDSDSIDFIKDKDRIVINILSNNDIVVKLIMNMIRCLKSLEKEYPDNIKIK